GVAALGDRLRRDVLQPAVAVGLEDDAVADHVRGAGLLLGRRLERHDGPHDAADDREDRDRGDGRDAPLEQLLALELLLAGDARSLARLLATLVLGGSGRVRHGWNPDGSGLVVAVKLRWSLLASAEWSSDEEALDDGELQLRDAEDHDEHHERERR